MRRRLHPETEEILWAAAESDDASVVEEFERRFPHLRAELATRRVMVEVLKKSRPREASLHAKFRPSPRAAARRIVWVPAVAVLLAALSFAGYRAAVYFMGLQEGPETTPPNPEATRDSGLVGPATSAPSTQSPETAKGINPLNPETERQLGVGERPPNPAPPRKLVTLVAETTLLEALGQIGNQGGVRVEVLPGVRDSRVRLFEGNPTDTMTVSLEEAIRLVERAGRVRVLANGPGEYLVFPGENSNEGAPFGPIRTPND